MKPIIVNANNAEKIKEVIDQAQSRARERIIVVEDVFAACRYMSSKINDSWHVPKLSLEGTTVSIDLHARNFPNAYNGQPESTHFNLVYKLGQWRLTAVFRHYVRREGHIYDFDFSDSAKDAIFANAKKMKF